MLLFGPVGSEATPFPVLGPRSSVIYVILELGFFIRKLGRERVCALHKGEVEIPADFSGVLWIWMDAAGARQFKLAGSSRLLALRWI